MPFCCKYVVAKYYVLLGVITNSSNSIYFMKYYREEEENYFVIWSGSSKSVKKRENTISFSCLHMQMKYWANSGTLENLLFVLGHICKVKSSIYFPHEAAKCVSNGGVKRRFNLNSPTFISPQKNYFGFPRFFLFFFFFLIFPNKKFCDTNLCIFLGGRGSEGRGEHGSGYIWHVCGGFIQLTSMCQLWSCDQCCPMRGLKIIYMERGATPLHTNHRHCDY